MRFAIGLMCALTLSLSQQVTADEWYPVEVDVWDPPLNTDLQRRTEIYVPLERADQAWKICVSIPHLKDAYWVTVNYALVDEARRLGVRLRVEEAGGYGFIDVQRRQVEECMDSGADALLLGGVTETGLNDLIAGYVRDGKPVIDLINFVTAPEITARAASTYWDNANLAGQYLLDLVGDKPTNILWFPGPKGPGWSQAADIGLHDVLEGSSVQVLETGWGDTGRAAQAELIKAALNRHDTVDYIIGTTVSVEAALDILRTRGLSEDVMVLAYYYGPGVHAALRRGRILAALTDKQGLNARLALDIAVRALQGEPYFRHVGAKVEVVDRAGLSVFDETTSIPPRGFRPTFSVDDWSND